MSYNEHGDYDYEAAATRGRFRSGIWSAAARSGKQAAQLVAAVLLGLLVAAALLALGIGGNYIRGRTIGAGVRDALEER